jgi:glycosyltransferase involved in cell wall biosynthesis
VKINLYENTLNASYIFASCLRRYHVDAHVILPGREAGSGTDQSSLPRWEDESLTVLPDWVHPLPRLRLRHYLTPGGQPFLRALGDCDLIHTFGLGPIWAARTRRPFVFLSHGGDLNVVPFRSDGIIGIFRAYLQRNALRQASLVLYGPWQQYAVDRLRLRNARYFPPWPIDGDKYTPGGDAERRAMRCRFDCDLVIFSPARHIHVHRPTHFGKGTAKMLRAFARWLRESKVRARLVLVEKGHVERSHSIIRELRIEPYVRWLKPMPKSELIACYRGSDVVLDQFSGLPGLGLGMIGREALACGCSLVTHFDMEVNHEYYSGNLPPLLSAATEEQIIEALHRLADAPLERVQLGRAAVRWIRETHHWERSIDQYIALYRDVLDRSVQ